MNYLRDYLPMLLKGKEIDHFGVNLLLLCQNHSESSCETFYMKNEFDLHENAEPVGGTQFHLNTKTRSDTAVNDNWKMA